MGWGSISPELFFLGTSKRSWSVEKTHIHLLSPIMGGGVEFNWQKYFLLRNAWNYQIYIQKLCPLTPTLHGVMGMGVNFHQKISFRNWLKCPVLHRKLMFGKFEIGKSWAQFTNIIVLDTELFCASDPNPQPFVVMWGVGKHLFHAVLYISCNFHQTFIFNDIVTYWGTWVVSFWM